MLGKNICENLNVRKKGHVESGHRGWEEHLNSMFSIFSGGVAGWRGLDAE